MIRAYLVNDHRNWDDNLVDHVLAFNTVKHESTSLSPALLVLGYQPENSPSIREVEKKDSDKIVEEFQKSWYEERQQQLNIQRPAKDNQNEAFLRQKKYYDKRRRYQKFKYRRQNKKEKSYLTGISAKIAPEYGRVYTEIGLRCL